MGHQDGIPSNMSGQNIPPASQHLDRDVLGHPLFKCWDGMGWDGGAPHSRKKSGQPHPT